MRPPAAACGYNVSYLFRGNNEESIKKLQKQLGENEREKGCDVEKIEEIKQMADVWDSLTVKEKNRILKECVEKIIIKGSDIEVSFVTF